MQNKNKQYQKRGRPVNKNQREQIINDTAPLFMQFGPHLVTIEMIAIELRISKTTIYKYFKNKEMLFTAIVESKCNEWYPLSLEKFNMEAVEKSLYDYSRSLLMMLTSEENMNMERMLVAKGAESRHLSGLFYTAILGSIRQLLVGQLERMHVRRILHVHDAMFSANMFIAMFKGSEIYTRLFMRLKPRPKPKEINAYCRQAVQLFIAAHQIPSSPVQRPGISVL